VVASFDIDAFYDYRARRPPMTFNESRYEGYEAPRLVARVLRDHGDPDLPWHRVLRSDGRIAFPPDSEGFAEQTQRLRAEGVDVRDGRVRIADSVTDLDGDLDAALWRL
jgi:alkylated DNA nucleotide flippase Atl1